MMGCRREQCCGYWGFARDEVLCASRVLQVFLASEFGVFFEIRCNLLSSLLIKVDDGEQSTTSLGRLNCAAHLIHTDGNHFPQFIFAYKVLITEHLSFFEVHVRVI